MANVINFIQTNAADELISKVLTGKTLNFTRMAVGDGFSYDMNVAKGFKTLVNEVLSLDITKKETLSPKSVKITSAFKNTDAQKEFYYREVGLYAQDPDTGEEVLYAYGNRNDAAELITPAGSNIVTKQLIFIISVGDSANVTFNINADVYALQEDMLDVQANKADKNLANTGMITNCLLEVPQNIKLEVANGYVTLKAGSVVIIPSGLDSNGNKVFQYINITEDLSYTASSVDVDCFLSVYLTPSPILTLSNVNDSYSGANITVTVQNSQWYDSQNNIVKCSNDTGVTWTDGLSLPIAIVRRTTAGIISIQQVFNGMGYIGSHVWIDKGVKGLIPNGKNPDGSLNNIEYTVPNIAFQDCSNWDYVNINFHVSTDGIFRRNYLAESEEILLNVDTKTYVPSKNVIYWKDNTTYKEVYVARGTIKNKKITSFTPFQPLRAVDKSSDKHWLSGLTLPSRKYIDYTLLVTGSNYTAPANGWFAIRKVVGVATAGVSCAVYNETGTTEIYRQTSKNSVATDEVAMIIPILKRQVLQVTYDATGETKYFRFIYAEGEAN